MEIETRLVALEELRREPCRSLGLGPIVDKPHEVQAMARDLRLRFARCDGSSCGSCGHGRRGRDNGWSSRRRRQETRSRPLARFPLTLREQVRDDVNQCFSKDPSRDGPGFLSDLGIEEGRDAILY